MAKELMKNKFNVSFRHHRKREHGIILEEVLRTVNHTANDRMRTNGS